MVEIDPGLKRRRTRTAIGKYWTAHITNVIRCYEEALTRVDVP